MDKSKLVKAKSKIVCIILAIVTIIPMLLCGCRGGKSDSNTEENDEMEPGLYDADDEMIASWHTLVLVHGMNISKDFNVISTVDDKESPYNAIKKAAGDATGLKLVISGSVNRIGEGSLMGCRNLETVIINRGVRTIGRFAFNGCGNISYIEISDSVTTIEEGAFMRCWGIKSIHIPKNITVINSYTFLYCSGLESISIPDGVKSIGDSAFCGCFSIKSIIIPDSVKSIGSYAFDNCQSLEYMVIGKGVSTIGEQMVGAKRLHNICYKGSKEEWAKIDISENNDKINLCSIQYNYVP